MSKRDLVIQVAHKKALEIHKRDLVIQVVHKKGSEILLDMVVVPTIMVTKEIMVVVISK